MSETWWFTPRLSEEPGFDRLGPHCKFTSGESRLELTKENFSLDCFYWVDCVSLRPYIFVSQDLREAMALGPRDARYVPVDASLSAPLPRSKNYMIMDVSAVEDIVDREQSFFHNTEDDVETDPIVGALVLRKDIVPRHDIFRDSFLPKFLFCTDELAVRVLQRQCSGISFVDPWHLDNALRFRSLGGIEDKSGDVPTYISRMLAREAAESNRVTDNTLLTDDHAIYANYSGHIPGVQFADVRMPLGPLGTKKTNLLNLEISRDQPLRSDKGEIITAHQLLNALERNGGHDAVFSVMAKFNLNPTWANSIMAARAYLWANEFAPSNFADVPASGPLLESVSKLIMFLEYACPGTLYDALQGDQQSVIAVKGTAGEGLYD